MNINQMLRYVNAKMCNTKKSVRSLKTQLQKLCRIYITGF